MARAVTTQHKTIATVAAWIVAFVIFFPILYTIITSFKSETEAIAGLQPDPVRHARELRRGRRRRAATSSSS